MTETGYEFVRLASGIRLGARVSGSPADPPILQIHGTGTGHRNYDLVSPLLARSFRVVDVDLPGYGESDNRADRRDADDFAEDVVEFIVVSGVRFELLHGTSFGGAIAMVVAALRPDLVPRLVVSCSFARLDRASHAARAMWKRAAEWGGAPALADVTSCMGFSRSFWERDDASDVQQAFVQALESGGMTLFLRDLDSTLRVDLEAQLPSIRAQTLLVGADDDILTPVHAGPSGLGLAEIEKRVETARLVVVEGCGHFIALERPDELARLIVEWSRLAGSPEGG